MKISDLEYYNQKGFCVKVIDVKNDIELIFEDEEYKKLLKIQLSKFHNNNDYFDYYEIIKETNSIYQILKRKNKLEKIMNKI
ncbi:MAG: hypothetical protein ACOC3Z_02070 [Nanoarchaeota archaeon]